MPPTISRSALLSFILSGFSLTAFDQQPHPSYRITEKEAVDKVMNLPEVRESNAYISRHSKDKRKLFSMTYGEPGNDQPYWWIAVGEDNGMAFITHFGFFVDVRTGKIRYFDTIEGKSISLQAWRKNLHRRYSSPG